MLRGMNAVSPTALSAHPGQAPAPALLIAAVTCLGREAPAACLQALAEAGLQDLAVVCLCPKALEAPTLALGRALLRRNALQSFACLPLAAGQSPRAAVNRLVAAAASPFLLLLSSDALLGKNSLPPLLRRLNGNAALAGVNPLLLAEGLPFGTAPARARVCHLGSVADSQGQLHYLYEGLDVEHPLAARERAFQIAHEAALLLRRDDFMAVGGFQPNLEALAGIDLCLRLAAARKGFFSSEPSARAVLCDRLDPWKTCGLWNSLLQRGRLDPALLTPDYHRQTQADGLEYGLTPWLAEGPRNLPLGAGPASSPNSLPGSQPGSLGAAWLRWRHAPEPDALLRLLRLLPPGERGTAVNLCRELPSGLPRALAWYTDHAARLAEFGEREKLPLLREQALEWLARAGRFQRDLLQPGMRALARAGIYDCSLDNAPSIYDAWLELREAGSAAGPPKAGQVSVGRQWPEIAVLMPVWNPNPAFLRAALDSVLAQEYGRWQLCLADDASTTPETPEMLRAYAARDARIRLVVRERNGHISRAGNSALALADAPWAAFLDHDDLLAPDALLEVARQAAERPRLRFMYSDEDKIDAAGVRRTPIFKAAFDFDLHFTGHLSSYATSTLRAAGGLRVGFEGSQDFDLSLRVTETLKPEEIAHIPRILYHWRIHAGSTTSGVASKPYVLEATRRALAAGAQRRGLAATVEPTGKNNYFKLSMAVPPRLRCSVILLADAPRPPAPALVECLQGLARHLQLETLWQPLNPPALSPAALAPFALADAALPPALPAQLQARILPPVGPHWATACRAAARAAEGDVLLFLDAALVPLGDCRPEQLAVLALRPDLAVVGGCVWQGGRLRHAGLYPDVTGLPFPLQRGAAPELLPSLCWGQLLLTRRVLAASRRCMAVRREDFLRHEGFDPALGPLAEADYGLRRERQGRYSLISPWGQWLLPEQAREEAVTPQALECFLKRWGEVVRAHGLRNPQLRAAPDFGWTPDLSGV